MVAGGATFGGSHGSGLLVVGWVTDSHEESESLELESLSVWRGDMPCSSASESASEAKAESAVFPWRGWGGCHSIRLGRLSSRSCGGLILVTGCSGIGGGVG
jgi:hypothetical protein